MLRSPVSSPIGSPIISPWFHAPASLSAAIDEVSGGILLTWDEVTGADSYNVYYAVDGGVWQSAATGVTDTSYTYMPTQAGIYRFGVRAVHGSIASAMTTIVASGLFNDVPDSEGIALMAFYEATNGDNWTTNTNWMVDSTVGNWFGVTVSGGHVTQLDLSSDANVSGTFALADLPASMEQLILYNTSSTITGALSDLPASMLYLHLGSTSSTITGSLADLPASMEQLILYNTSSTITGALSDLPASMLYLYLYNTSSTITGSLADLPASMARLYLYNTSSTITGSLADLPASMARLYLGSTSSTITGSLADLPASILYLHLYNTSSTITGSLSDLPASMLYLHLGSTSSTITGGATAVSATGIIFIITENCSEDQATVNDVIDRIYADRALFTYAAPSLDIGGNNAAPSGIYQYAATPSTALEKVYALKNDDDLEGFNKWDITYTLP